MDYSKLDVLFYGMTIVDYLFILKSFPKKYEINKTEKKIKMLGGSATNSATYTSSWGLKTGIFGCHYLGKDAESEFFLHQLKKYKHLDFSMLKQKSTENTQCAYIFIDDSGERTILADASPKTYRNLTQSALAQARLLCVDGKFANSSLYMQKAVEMAKTKKIPVVLSDTDISEPHVALADIILNATKTTENRIAALKKKLLSMYQKYSDKIVIHTLGPFGCLVINQGKCRHFSLPKNISKIVDTTGAGDTFRAGIVYGHCNGWSIEKCVNFAMFSGTKACSYHGGVAQKAFSWPQQFSNFYQHK